MSKSVTFNPYDEKEDRATELRACLLKKCLTLCLPHSWLSELCFEGLNYFGEL